AFDESSPLRPTNPYAATKAAAEYLVRSYWDKYKGTLPISRHFLFVSDAIQAFLLVLEKGTVGDVYNVGTSFEIPIIQLARELVRMVGFMYLVS
ncbi:hypothetical protein XENOCAPTIV_015840, partial [Xenoophorus captivus]